MGCSLSQIVFQPPEPQGLLDPEDIVLLTTEHGNRIPAVWCYRDAPQTILMSHGNAEDLRRVVSWVREVMLPRVRANVLVYEYSGYSEQNVMPSEEFVYTDCEAALKYLTDGLKVPLTRIVLFGRSLGSGPSCFLAEKYPQVMGLILQTPITSVLRVLIDFRFTLPGDMFPNVDRMPQIRCPLLLLHGSRDELVPASHPEELLQLCSNQNKLLMYVEGAGHNNLEVVAGSPLFQVIQGFLDSLM